MRRHWDAANRGSNCVDVFRGDIDRLSSHCQIISLGCQRGPRNFFCTSIVVINIRLSAYISKAVIIGCCCYRMCKCGSDSSVYIWRAVTSCLEITHTIRTKILVHSTAPFESVVKWPRSRRTHITARETQSSRAAQGAYLEVEYIRNVLSVSGTLKYADSGTAWCHSGNIEQFFLEPFKNHPCQPKHYCTVYAYCAAPLLIIAFKQNARVCEHLLFL